MNREINRRVLRFIITLLAVLGTILGTIVLNVCYRRYLSIAYPLAYRDAVESASTRFGIDASLIYAVIHTESGFDPDAVSPAGAKGLMQLTDDTYRWALAREGNHTSFDVQNLFDPATNIHYGVYVLTLLGQQFETTETILAAYNAGQGHVREWLEDPTYSTDGIILDNIPYRETADYVQRVQSARERYRRLYDIP